MKSSLCLGVLGLVGMPLLSACQVSQGDGDADVTSFAQFAASECPMPTGMNPEAIKAVEEVNQLRKAAGLACIDLSPEISTASERHCRYYTANSGTCIAKPHREVAACSDYVAEIFTDRMKAADYGGQARFEVMAYVGNGGVSVQEWLDSVWHRIPILSSDVNAAGYGSVSQCDTMDFGWSGSAQEVSKNVVYPLDGQTDVPRTFGGRESPEPPAPPAGWPSGYPITVWAPGLTVTEHSISVAGSDEPLDHIFLAPGDPAALGLLVNEFMLYTHKPLAAQTKYRVVVSGTQDGKPTTFDWTFTTR